jgi:uncharacterized protein YjbJ (UPF0337 family)
MQRGIAYGCLGTLESCLLRDGSATGASSQSNPSTPSRGEFMNKDQVKGSIKDVAGKVQETTGQLIGSTEQQLKGIKKQVEGKTQKAVGDVKEVLKDAGHR